MDGWLLHELESTIEHAWATAPTISPYWVECDAIEETLSGLDCGRIRVAERQGVGQWTVNQWVKKAVLLSFRLSDSQRPRVIDRRLGRCTGFECCHRRCGNLQFCTGWGLRPVRAVRSCTSNVPKPGNVSAPLPFLQRVGNNFHQGVPSEVGGSGAGASLYSHCIKKFFFAPGL